MSVYQALVELCRVSNLIGLQEFKLIQSGHDGGDDRLFLLGTRLCIDRFVHNRIYGCASWNCLCGNIRSTSSTASSIICRISSSMYLCSYSPTT